MANTSKKPKKKIKKQVRRTLGAVFLASAIAVAAIPTSSYSGGNAQAEVITDSSGEKIYTHVVTAGYKDSEGEHSENYLSDPPSVAATYKHVYVTYMNPEDASADKNSSIPICADSSTIYCTGDGDFKFAYVPASGKENDGGDKFAVILGYSHTGALAGGTLTIPDTVEAYLNYNDNAGSGTGFVAVGKSGNYLYYETDSVTSIYTVKTVTEQVQATDVNDKKIFNITEDGALMMVSGSTNAVEYNEDDIDTAIANLQALDSTKTYVKVAKMVPKNVDKTTYYAPCFYSAYSTWCKNGTDVDLYYFPTNNFRQDGTAEASRGAVTYDQSPVGRIMPILANTQSYERISGAKVAYIGNQSLRSTANGYEIDATSVGGVSNHGIINDSNGTTKGIFANNGNISTLIIGNNLSGIGDYAFYGCTAIKSVTLANGIETIGNHAFDGCRNMQTLSIPNECLLTLFGAYAFKNCQALTSFVVPINVTKLGDGLFKGCSRLESINLLSTGNGALSEIGQFVFKDCSSLTGIKFPDSWTQTLELSEFEGCSALQYISCRSTSFDIVASTSCDFTWEAFKNEFNSGESSTALTRKKFYIEASSALSCSMHPTCVNNEISFKYLDQEVYELTKTETGLTAADHPTVTYQIDNNGSLTQVTPNGTVVGMVFPDYIGPYSIKSIGAEAFMDNCTLTSVIISESIQSIGARAFQGCHNLAYVVFNTDNVVIGEDAFKTQKVTTHNAACPKTSNSNYATYTAAGIYAESEMTNADNTPKVTLTFVGKIDANSTPYKYAMSTNGTYNYGSQALSYIEYTSGWPSFLTVQYQSEDTNGDGIDDNWYSELVDFPTIDSLEVYKDAPYLTDAQKSAATYVYTNMSNPSVNLTEDQLTFKNAASSLTIPTGINRIRDGLYYYKTMQEYKKLGKATSAITAFPVTIYGLDEIEANIVEYTGSDITPSHRDSNGLYLNFTEPAITDYANLASTTGSIASSDFAGCTKLNTLTIYGGCGEIDDYAFYGCTNLSSIKVMSNDTTTIGDYAFGNCTAAEEASISSSVSDLGLAPFIGDTGLSTVEFNNSGYYKCDNSIIYGLTSGTPTELVEALPSRTNSYRSDSAISTLKDIDQDAFNGSKISVVDLSDSKITTVPKHTFYNAANLNRVIMPNGCTTVGEYVFEDSTVNEVSGTSSIIYPPATFMDAIDLGSGLETSSTTTTNNNKVTIYAPSGSNLYTYAVSYDYTAEIDYTPAVYTVNFYGYDETTGYVTKLIDTQSVEEGDSPISARAVYSVAQSYVDSNGNPYVLAGWQTDARNIYTNEQVDTYDMSANAAAAATKVIDFYAYYELSNNTHTVVFNDNAGTAYRTYNVPDGKTLAEAQIEIPVLANITDEDGNERYNSGWNADGAITTTSPITRDVTFNPIFSRTDGPYTVTLMYRDPTTNAVTSLYTISNVASGSSVTSDVNVITPPTVSGYKFDGWSSAIMVPTTANLANVTTDIVLTGTYSSSTGISDSDAVNSGSAYYAYYYYPNGIDLFTRIAVSAGDKAYDIVKPEGYTTGYAWSPNPAETVMNSNHNFILVAASDEDTADTYKVSYYYSDGVTLYQELRIENGSYAPNLIMPAGYTGCVWSPDPAATAITKNTRFTMVAGNGTNADGTGNAYYTLTVVNGSGSGTYLAGSTAIIVASEPSDSSLQFGSWTVSPDSTIMASKGLSATTITMPAENVTVTANYVTKTTTSTGSGGNGGNGGSGGNTATPTSSGTTVVIDKNGLSNTGVVSATVNGSSDNFTIKVSETSASSEAVLKALLAQYGDVSNIIYFPMDISLYDASGTKLITDTTGLTVTITLPLPDSMIQYGGNNKVGAVLNNQLESLSPRFTTINGVDCVTFTCTHFSPYVIYVDTKNITQAGANGGNGTTGNIDSTPKTGDFLKPKWFIAIGLAAISVFLFVKKDKSPKKAKAVV